MISWVSTALAEDPLMAAKASLGITTAWAMRLPWLAQVALAVFVIEFGQYWMHRLMHNSTPFWLTHAPHHHTPSSTPPKARSATRSSCSSSA